VPLSPDPPRGPDANIPLHIQQKLRKKAYMDWPYLCNKTAHLKDEILTAAFRRLKNQIKSCGRNPAAGSMGFQLDWNVQLYTFIKLQLKAQKDWRAAELKRHPTEIITKHKTRKALALLVANSGGWGIAVRNRILQQEVAYIRSGKLPSPKQGRHVKAASWISDEGTMLAIREYISLAGKGMLLLQISTHPKYKQMLIIPIIL